MSFVPCLWRRLVSARVSLAGRDAGETRSGWGFGRVWACEILAPEERCWQEAMSALGFAQGVVDPRAKRRFWD